MIKQIRDFYGLTQAELSRYLLVNRSSLSMTETEERSSINGDSFHKLGRISLAVPELVKYPDIGDPLQDEQLNEALKEQKRKLKKNAEDRLKECNYQYLKTQRTLDALKEKQDRALKIIGQLSPLKEKTLPEDAPLVDFIESKARERQKESGIDVQYKLVAQLAGLQAEMDFLKKYIAD